MNEMLLFIGGWIAVILFFIILSFLLKSPYKYPYKVIDFDVSGKRSPDIMNLLDDYINKEGIDVFQRHLEKVQQWKDECKRGIDRRLLKKMRRRQFEETIDDSHMFKFNIKRSQTRYQQINYIRTPYSVTVVCETYSFDYKTIKERYDKLSEIDFVCTLAEYHSKKQRKLMTPQLKEQILLRDNYTCQLCGKYMPDCVGLQIDHIIPIKKGGKSVPSNLQVLCSKCNGKKSAN